MRFLILVTIPALSLMTAALQAETSALFLPQAIGADQFTALQSQSPFTRALNMSDSLVLTGIARVDGTQMATLLNKETKETYVVSSAANTQGWKMVELNSNDDLEKVAAKISVDGGEVVTVRYAEWQLKPGEAKPGGGGSGGAVSGKGDKKDGDGRRGPPSETREKLAKLSEDQRNKIYGKMKEIHEKNPEMSREDRGKIFHKMLDKVADKK